MATARPARRRPAASEPPELSPSPRTAHFGVQEHCLACLVRYPALLARVNSRLVEVGTSPLSAGDFGRVENQQIFQALSQAEAGTELRERLDPMLHAYLEWLLETASAYGDLPPDKLDEDILATALRLREGHLHTRLTQLRFLQEDAQAERQREVILETGEAVTQLREELREVQRAFSRCFSLSRRRLEQVMGLEPFR